MKKLLFLIPVVGLLYSCGTSSNFVAEDDVYAPANSIAMRPKTNGKPEANYDGYVYQQENSSRVGYYNPDSELGANSSSGETRVINNYYVNNDHMFDNGWYGYAPFRPRRWNSPGIYFSHGWGHNPWAYDPWGWNRPWGMNSWGMNPYGHFHQPWGWGMNSWGYNSWGYNSWGYGGMNCYGFGNGFNTWGGAPGMHGGWGGHGMYSGMGNSGGSWGSSAGQGNIYGSGRPTFSSNQNPGNIGVGKGNASPIAANGRPVEQVQLAGHLNGNGSVVPSGRDVASSSRPTASGRVIDGSTLTRPRVDAPARPASSAVSTNESGSSRPTISNDRGTSTTRPSSPGAVTVDRGNSRPSASGATTVDRGVRPSASTPNSRPNASSPAARPSNNPSARPSTSPSTRPSTSAPTSRPSSTTAPAPRTSTPSNNPSSRPSTSAPRSSGSSGGSVGGGSRGGSSGGSSGGSAGGGSRSGSSGGSAGGGSRGGSSGGGGRRP